jgi:hypothetical protein
MTTSLKYKNKTEALLQGRESRRLFLNRVESIVKPIQSIKYRHLYVYSPPGLGKTYSIRKILREQGREYNELTGNTSMFAFGLMLAVAQHNNPTLSPKIIFVDDSDELFNNEASCNIMKNALEGTNTYTYEKSMANTENKLSELQREAILHFRGEGKSGFEIPTHNLTFLFASNNRLPQDDEVQMARKKGLAKSPLLVHRNAIRSRCRVGDFDLEPSVHWGWLADVALHTDCLTSLGLDKDIKEIILGFLWENWDHLKEKSVRTIEKMGITLLEHTENYERYWEMEFINAA